MGLISLGKDPIPGENPCGSDVRYDEIYESVKAEIDKLSSPTASSHTDWNGVVENSVQILSAKSKDFTIACYLAGGLLETRKIEGFEIGIQILKDLAQTFWDTLFPAKKRMRGRIGAITWLIERSETQIAHLQQKGPVKEELILKLNENLTQLDAFLAENMPNAPMLNPIQRELGRIPVEKAAPEKPPEVKEKKAEISKAGKTVPKKTAPKPKAAEEPAESLESFPDAIKAVDSAFKKVLAACPVMLRNDLKSPLAYHYRRMASWSQVQALPQNSDGLTQMAPPNFQIMDTLNQLRENGNWAALIANAEENLSRFIFWFDLGRQVAEGLMDLGNDYKQALEAVNQQTAYFIQRLPGIGDLSFSDETPFADPETRNWLKTLSAGNSSSAGQGSEKSGAGHDEHYQLVVRKAKALVRKKKIPDAVRMLQEQMHHSLSRCDALRWRLAIAQVLLVHKKGQLALPHLEQILSDIDEYKLESWDPQLALDGLTTALQGYRIQNGNENKEQSENLLHRIAKINPVEALRLHK
ncbi:MAG: type VI secretion system protein TssA [Desulfobacteraceae bacterium]|nr:type VI secretion system protein TssA [Desulfobacteraceae bacterium]